jgi:GNAT superfamily N-acetyltransferase
MFQIAPDPQLHQASLCEPVLRSLPRWFGREASTRQYLEDIERQPTFIAYHEKTAAGFLTLTEHSPASAEIHVMAVLPEFHRHGAGRAMLAAAEVYLRRSGVKFLQVKTLSPRHPSPEYALTRAFYLGTGFHVLQEFTDLWGEDLPCWQLLKAL